MQNINFNFFVFFTIRIILILKMDVWIDIPVDKYLCGQISMWTNVPVDKCLMDICSNRYFSGGTFVLQPYSGSLCWRKIFPLTWILSHHLMKSFLGKKWFPVTWEEFEENEWSFLTIRISGHKRVILVTLNKSCH